MIRADFITSLVLIALGVATLAESWRMPRFVETGGNPYSAPGLVPGMLGVAIALLGLILCLRTVHRMRADAEAPPVEGGWLRSVAALGLCAAYAIVLVSRVPFWLATFVFVLVFILGFEFADPKMRTSPARRVIAGVTVAAVASAAVSYVFQEVFLVRLP